MTACVNHYYGRGGARICLSRPRIEPEHRISYPALVLQSVDVFSPVHILTLLIIILTMALLSSWLFDHFQSRLVRDREKNILQPVKLVMQHQTSPPKKQTAPPQKKIEQPKPMLPPLQPATEQPKARPQQVVRKKTKPVQKPKPAVSPKPAPKPKPLVKKRIDLEDSLHMEKKFDFPMTDSRPSVAARTVAPPSSASLYLNRKMPDSISDMQTVSPDLKRPRFRPNEVQEKLNQLEEDLSLESSSNSYREVETNPAQEIRRSPARTRKPDFNRTDEIEVAVAEDNSYDYSNVQPDQTLPKAALPTALKNRTPDTDAAQSAFPSDESGVSLIQLKACGPVEKTMKIKLAELVKEKGYPTECMNSSGIYKFYWPAERFTVQHFNVIIYTSQGRIATDRCEELTNACDCLTTR